MDAFAVSIGKGLTVSRVRVQDAVKSTLWFGGFQMLFPILGYFAASTFSKYVTQFDHWIIFALLVFIGGNMVHEAFEEDEENSKETAQFDWKHMLPLAVACSIDAFAVGVSLAFMFTKAARAATNDADYEARMKAYARLISEDAASDWLYTRKCFTVASTKVSGYPTSMINRRMPLAGLTVK